MAAAAASSSPHVALLAFPFGSHPNVLHTIATLLASAAPHAVFSLLTSHRYIPSLGKLPSPANLSLEPVSDGCDQFPSEARPTNPEDAVSLFISGCPGFYVEGMQKAATERGRAPITSIICDAFVAPLVARVAEEMDVPWVVFFAGGTAALTSHLYTDQIRLEIGVGEEAVKEKKLDFIPSLSSFQVSDLPEGVVHGDLRSPFAQLLHRMGNEISHATAVALNTCAALEGPAVADLSTNFSRCLPIAPLHLLLQQSQPEPQEGDSILSWLDGRPASSVVYIAFGTFMSLEASELTTVAEALEATGFPFLWSLKEAARLQLPCGFLEKGAGLAVEWAPQVEVLRHPAVGVFLTHGGWNSVLESVAEGVPMICRPVFADHRMNARQVVDVWRIGLWLEGDAMTRDGVAAALKTVMKGEEGRGMRERARVLGRKAEEAAADEGGSSRKSLGELIEVLCYP